MPGPLRPRVATRHAGGAGTSAALRSAGRPGQQQAVTHGAEFRLALGDSPVARILQLTGVDTVMPLYRDVEHSLATPPVPAVDRQKPT